MCLEIRAASREFQEQVESQWREAELMGVWIIKARIWGLFFFFLHNVIPVICEKRARPLWDYSRGHSSFQGAISPTHLH